MAGSLAHLLLLIFLCTPGVRSEGSKNTEAAALLHIKGGFSNGDAILSDWNSTAGSPCSWTGIQCQNNSVAAIALQQLGLEGTITPEGWADLPNLQALALHSNYLTGSLPKGWRLSDKVQLLYLFNNSLYGEPFSSWELPSQLLDLQLDTNNFTGSVPASLPKTLTYLYLNNNSFTGTLPGDWALPDSLQVLSLYNNQLSGTIGFTLPPALSDLSLFTNRFNGTINQLDLPDTMQNLLLFNNSLTGGVPQQLPSSLKQLSISYNQLSGTIPADWRLPSGIQLVFLSANRLSGSLPNLSLPDSLTSLEFGNNSLTGTLPKFDFPESLLSIVLFNNRLSGTLPDDWYLPLTAIELSNNSFSGTIPANWTMPNLLYISLFNNNLTAIQILPQKGDGLCGEVPTSPTFYEDEERLTPGEPLNCTSEPQAPPASPSTPSPAPSGDTGYKGSSSDGSGDSSTVGIVVGVTVGCAALVAAALAVWWYVWSRRRASRADTPKGDTSTSPSSANLEPSKFEGKQSWQSNGTEATTNTKLQDSACDVEDIVMVGSGTTATAGAAASARSNLEPADGSSSLEPAPTPPRDPLLELALREARSDDSGAASSPGGRLGNRQNLEHLKMWLVDFNDIELIKQIGEGSYGRVYLAKWKEMLVACKILLNTALGQDVYSDDTAVHAAAQAVTLSNPVLQNLHKEAGIMAALRHPNIMSFLGVCPSPPCVLSEFCSRGSLADVLRAARQSPQLAAKLDWPRRLSMMMDCAKGLLYLHGRNPPIIHRDLKAANLLIDVNWKAKVADFNLSRIVAEGSILSSAQATNPRWLAPEVLNGEPASQQSDVFSYGMVCWECLTWSVPFASENHWTLVKFVSNGGRPEIPPLEALPGQDTASFQGLGAYIDLIQRCWAQDPADRPSFPDIVADLRSMLAPTLKQVRGPAPKQRGQNGTSEPAASHTTQQTSGSAKGSEPAGANVEPAPSVPSSQ